MTFKKILILALLAAAGASASAADIKGDWGALGPAGASGRGITTSSGPVDDAWTFTLGDGYDVLSIINWYQSNNLDGSVAVELQDAKLTLWKGTPNDGVADVNEGWEWFSTAETNHTFTGLTSGSYYFEITGTSGAAGSDYYLNVAANVAPPPAVVPEPANVALLLGGIGLFGVMAKRRKAS